MHYELWSGIQDLNLCPPDPKSGAIMPNYANSGSVLSYCKRRLIENLDKTSFQFFSDSISTNSERTGAGGGTRTRMDFSEGF